MTAKRKQARLTHGPERSESDRHERFVTIRSNRERETAMQRQRGELPAKGIPAFAVILMAAILTAAGCRQDRPQAITVVSWGGSYGRAVDEGAIIPFTEATGIPVNVEDYNGGLAEIRAQVDIGNIHWDVVSLEIADAVRACDEGLLEPIDIDALPPGHDGTPAAEDFVPREPDHVRCRFLYASTVYAYNEDYIPGDKPAAMADFFDLEKVSGSARDAARSAGQSGVCADRGRSAAGPGHSTLGTPDGLDRAFRKLDAIKDEVIWWEAGAQHSRCWLTAEVVMSTAYNGASSTHGYWRASRL